MYKYAINTKGIKLYVSDSWRNYLLLNRSFVTHKLNLSSINDAYVRYLDITNQKRGQYTRTDVKCHEYFAINPIYRVNFYTMLIYARDRFASGVSIVQIITVIIIML